MRHGVAVVLSQNRAVAVVHGGRVHAAERFTLGGTTARLASAGVLLAEAATAGVPRLPLALAVSLGRSMTLAVRRALARTL